jgi:uncharacterized Zn-finger protein
MRGILLSYLQMANLEINLDFLIRDCLKAYTEETLEFDIPSPAQLAKIQYDEIPSPLKFPENVFSFNPIEELSPLSPAEASKEFLALNHRFACDLCSKKYRGKRELNRHMKKHDSPNKFSCTIDGCLQSTYRIDAMRCHIKKHEKRLKTESESKKPKRPKLKKVTQKKD